LLFKGHTCRINAVTFDKQCSSVISCAEDKILNIIDVRTNTQIYSVSLESEPLTLTWMGTFLLIGDNDGNLNIWNHQEAIFISQIHCHDGKFCCYLLLLCTTSVTYLLKIIYSKKFKYIIYYIIYFILIIFLFYNRIYIDY